MKKVILVLRKIRREIGANVVRLIWSIPYVLYQSFRPSPRNIRHALKSDHDRLRRQITGTAQLLEQARFYVVTPSDDARRWFERIVEEDREDRWISASFQLAYLATVTWDGVEDPVPYVQHLYEKPNAYFRFHELNKGNNDRWEYYLMPWHRTYGRLVIALLDERMRPLVWPIWQRYDRFFRHERPWMTRFIIGSNVSAVLAGYTLHALVGYLLHEEAGEKAWYLRRYVAYGKRLHRAIHAGFDAYGDASIPFEGVLYGGFWFVTAIVLGLIQRRLGLAHGLLDYPQLNGLSEYVWKSRTSNGDYQTSGDSRPYTGHVPVREVHSILDDINASVYARKLDALIPDPHFLNNRIQL